MSKLLEQNFDNYMNQSFEFKTWFNSHHLNILKRCGYNSWSSLLPVYESLCNPKFIRMVHRIEIYNGEVKTTLPKKLTDIIHTTISVYFRLNTITPKINMDYSYIGKQQ